MLPVVLSVTPGNDNGTTTTSHTVSLPSVNAGDRLVIAFSTREANSSYPAGWAELYDAGTGGQACTSGAYRDCDGTEGASITVTTGTSRASAWAVIRIQTGTFNTGSAPQVGTVATGNSVNPNPPSLTPSWGSDDVLWIATAAGESGASANAVTSYPTSYSDNQTSTSAVSTGWLHLATRSLAAASEDPGTFTVTPSDQWAAQTIAVRGSPGLSVGAPLIGSTSTLASPTATPAVALVAPLMSSGSVLYGPAQRLQISAPLRGSISTLSNPVVQGPVLLAPPLLTSSNTLYTPVVGAPKLPPLIGSVTTLYGPSIATSLGASLLQNDQAFYSASITKRRAWVEISDQANTWTEI